MTPIKLPQIVFPLSQISVLKNNLNRQLVFLILIFNFDFNYAKNGDDVNRTNSAIEVLQNGKRGLRGFTMTLIL